MKKLKKIGFGGGCHWCTEAVFQSLKGVKSVQQGWIASKNEHFEFSEAVIVDFDPSSIPLKVLIEIHLHTHKSTSEHSMRKKYRSAVYVFNQEDEVIVMNTILELQSNFNNKLVTKVLGFSKFKPSREEIANYYYRNPKKPFCETFINPKLQFLLKEYSGYVSEQLKEIKIEK
ncbi:peptide-methionine (S)-S-oxide reductase [Psychroserpens sp.]|uniref:peptide-methionine (S)-S-oxide reductase n=1 Tax=Psychroserpens sp. TaxID=2020870 RepID=UPI001227EF14|nr:peptide-methionine (S)-S-oxide reductase [Psychroserpens sp.]RZN83333.1 MAG: peptide methionine sulfoxide reductase [Winogradskyella sp.]MBO6605821.1 peptide-methionine (S)-S-oxide reductase [Psychroserpens sp.]MBO6630457.1 peptide-methionine (S)-S-oxide reductase [Psychroserpens sp.]MBO6652808.1 peptide-methionine (S)-S-oxide reductase [Psychroserpens sp.]MBO6681420.1 peptide-methionine (S)-S-oxide reductase [Psychroserpens sp.]